MAIEKIRFQADNGDIAEFFVLEQTTVGGRNYILVTDHEEGDGEALILKDISGTNEDEAVYDIVSDEAELKSVADIFSNLLDDISFE